MKKQIKYILTGALVALLAVGIAACKSGEARLSSPANLQVSETDILTWDEVEGAKSYVVTIDEKEYGTKTNSLDIFLLTTEPKTYEIKVAAYDSDYRLTNWSDSVEYTVPAQPEFKFEPTDDGRGYQIRPSGKTLVAVLFGAPVYHYDGKSYGVGKVIVPSSYEGKPVKEIATNAFNECEGLTGLILPDTVEEIKNNAFDQCTNLKKIRLPAFIETIETSMFYRCKSLKEIELPEGLREIKHDAFRECESLERIGIPLTVEQIDSGIFRQCPNLKTVTVDEGNEVYRGEGNCIIRRADNALIVGCIGSVIPQGVTSIHFSAFEQCPLREIKIPQGVTSIRERAFYNCTELERIEIPASVTKISPSAFENCSKLERVEFSSGIKTIDNNAFKRCTMLKSVRLPDTLETIKSTSFPREMTVTIDKNNPYLKADGNCIVRKSDEAVMAEFSYPVLSD